MPENVVPPGINRAQTALSTGDPMNNTGRLSAPYMATF